MKKHFRLYFYSFLCFTVILAVTFRENADVFYGNIGNYFYKKNDVIKAQNFYERAFIAGNKDSKLRENYVNSIINSPLTIDSQTKLVNIVQGEIKDNAYENAEYFLYNLKREIHNKYPNNYILQAPYNQKIIHWGKLPITYTIKNPHQVPQELVNAVDSAFDEWEKASSCRIKFSKVRMNPDIWVEFIHEEVNSPEYGRKYIVAYTTPAISQNTLENMHIKINTKNLDGEIYSPNQIYNTALHEIFHALGFMGHSYEQENIMHMSKDKNALINDTQVMLTNADKLTLELLYKIKPDITNADELEYNYIPYLVLGNNKSIYSTKFREARDYIRRAPSIPNGYIDLADALVAKQRYKEAIDMLERALNLADNNDTKYIIYYNLSVSYYYIGMYNLAEDYINYAKKIKDEDELHYLNAEIYLKKNEIDKAIQEYNYLIQRNPQNLDYTVNLANIYITEHKYFEARKILKNFIKENPTEKNNPRISGYKFLFI